MGSVWFAVVSVLVLVQLSFADKNRCMDKWHNVYVIYPGSQCGQFVQWAISNPSGRVLSCPHGMRFNVVQCHCDLAANVKCPASKSPVDCSDLAPAGIKVSGIYNFTVGTCKMGAYCDMKEPGHEWLLIQKRETSIQKPLDFYEGMRSYVEGFGQLGFEFWWGLDNMYQLTNPKKNSRKYELRVDLKDFNGHSGFGVFTDFSISSASDGYKLYLGSLKEGNVGKMLGRLMDQFLRLILIIIIITIIIIIIKITVITADISKGNIGKITKG
ncbi:microfibril-associated glycoprotein 4-like [Lingula anatina]|uniref:Microfibril-associated glycoprotein 4-like n=1 Tax=Lingula anatina TaxID=7574 RepID=A0A1S3H728_LINAN|nr:microfibril-associated glycoprotein 4-like [Lingula anatina]|eukprot:XP_013381803.1 microfibril-associated glycoprotein 4-like [Lingula anatina]